MDAPVSKCLRCGELLSEPRKLKKFCSYACRGQQRAIEASTDHTGLVRSKNPKQNRELRRVKSLRRGCDLRQSQLLYLSGRHQEQARRRMAHGSGVAGW
jgi:hypothetical protein